MPRTVTNSVILTQVKNYHWQVIFAFDTDGTLRAQVIEDYDVVDDKGVISPEGHQQKVVTLSDDEQAVMDALMIRSLKQASDREQVAVDITVQTAVAAIDATAAIIPAGTITVKPIVGKITA